MFTLALAWVTLWGKPGTLALALCLVRGLRDLELVTGDRAVTTGAWGLRLGHCTVC